MTGLILFEDQHWADLSPLADLLPVPALAFGASNLAARWLRAVEAPLVAIEARPMAMSVWRDAPAIASSGRPETILAVNAAALPGPWLAAVLAMDTPAQYLCGDRVVAARFPAASLDTRAPREAFESFLAVLDLPRQILEAHVIARPWQMIEWNAAAIAEDLTNMRGVTRGVVHEWAASYEADRIIIEKGARVDAYAVLDAREGPILLGADTVVQSHTLVIGPCAVGAGTQLLGGAVGRSTFGPGCRIAGEVDESIWQGYANKRHHGFVGHSLIGEWTNLGAMTTTSDLKNNYGTIRVQTGGGEVDSGLIKLGSIIGGAVKTGIGTLLPTGACIGTGAHLFGGGRYAPKRLPAFAWWDGETVGEYQLEKFLATARVAMSRRSRELSPADEAAVRALFASTAAERVP